MSPQQKTALGTDSWLLVLLALLLMNVLFGGRLWGALFPRPGVADLLQGVLGFVLMLLMLFRVLRLKKQGAQAEAQVKEPLQ